MKTCANCGLESNDEVLSCPSCTMDAFISSSPEALGHVISPAEQRFWERMNFRQFAIFLIRLQSMWFLFHTVVEASYLVDYLAPKVYFTLHAKMIVVRTMLYFALVIFCLRYADRIVSWFVKDIIPKMPVNAASQAPGDNPSKSRIAG